MKFSQISISSIAVCNILLFGSLLLPSKLKDCDTAISVMDVDIVIPSKPHCTGLFDYFPSEPSFYMTGHQVRLYLDLLAGKSNCFSTRETLEIISNTIFQDHDSYFTDYKSPKSGSGLVMMLEKGNEYGVWAEIQILRNLLKSDMKLELFHQGDIDINFIQDFSMERNIEVVDLSDLFGISTFTYNQWIPFAILASKFKHVMVVDPSLTFLRSPDAFTENVVYQEYGAVLFQDQMPAESLNSNLYVSAGSLSRKPFLNSAAFHKNYAGVMMIDKQKHGNVVIAACAIAYSHKGVGYGTFDYLAAGFALVGSKFAYNFTLPVVDEDGKLKAKHYDGAHFCDTTKICWFQGNEIDQFDDMLHHFQDIRQFAEFIISPVNGPPGKLDRQSTIGLKVRIWNELRKNSLPEIVSWVESKLFPLLLPTYKSAEDLRKSFRGRGIVMYVDDHTAATTKISVSSMRSYYGCDLPIEIFYIPGKLSQSHHDMLENFSQVSLVDISTSSNVPLRYDKKNVYALTYVILLACSFEEAIFIDSSITLVASPDLLFESQIYKKSNLLLFLGDKGSPDAQKYFKRAIKKTLKLLFSQSRLLKVEETILNNPIDSRLIVVNKNALFEVLMTSTFISNEIGVDFQSEVLNMSHQLLEKKIEYPNQSIGVAGVPVKNGTLYEICSGQDVHIGEDGNPVWISGGYFTSTYANNYTLTDITHWLTPPGTWSTRPGSIKCLKTESLPVSFPKYLQTILQKTARQTLAVIPPTKEVSQISPWSYKNHRCSYSTYDNQFFSWARNRELLWSKLKISSIVPDNFSKSSILNSQAVASTFQGSGIIFSCHPRIIKETMTSILILRNLDCQLPIQIWHMNELNSSSIESLRMLRGVTVHNLWDYANATFSTTEDDNRLYQIKAAALLYSSFEKVLFMDSDNNALKDPSFLFESAPFKETGAIFWKDMWKTRPDNPIWNLFGLDCVDEYEQESGQIAIDKSFPGVLEALSLTLYVLGQSEFYFKLMLGDKDFFRLSWRTMNQPFHMIRPHLSILGFVTENNGFCGLAMAQYAPFWDVAAYGPYPTGYRESDEPELLFIHANMLKYYQITSEPMFTVLKRYQNPSTEYGKGLILRNGCISIDSTKLAKVETIPTPVKWFENQYRKAVSQSNYLLS